MQRVAGIVVVLAAIVAAGWLALRADAELPPVLAVESGEATEAPPLAAAAVIAPRAAVGPDNEGDRVADDRAGRTARVVAFLAAAAGAGPHYGGLATAYLDGIDVETIDRAARESGLTADDAIASLDPRDPSQLLLALAFAADFRDEHAAFLVRTLGSERNPMAPDLSGLAALHALRLRGRLTGVWRLGLADRLLGALGDDGQVMSNETSAVLSMLFTDGVANGAGGAEADRFGTERLQRAFTANDGPLLRWLVDRNEGLVLARVHEELQKDSSHLQEALVALDRPQHFELLRSVVETNSYSRSSWKRAAIAGLLAMGTPEAVEKACAALLSGGNPNEIMWILDRMPAMVAARSVVALADRTHERIVALRESIRRVCAPRLEPLRLSAMERRRAIDDLVQLANWYVTGPEGRRFCLDRLGSLGTLDDRGRVLGIGRATGLFAEAEAAVAAIEARTRRGIP